MKVNPAPSAPWIGSQAVLYFFYGILVVAVSYAMIGLCQRKCNHKPSKIVAALHGAAYPVYFLHPLVINPLVYTWQKILTAIGFNLVFGGYGLGPYRTGTYMQASYVWAGYMYVAILSQVIVWPLGYAFKKIPYMDQIF